MACRSCIKPAAEHLLHPHKLLAPSCLPEPARPSRALRLRGPQRQARTMLDKSRIRDQSRVPEPSPTEAAFEEPRPSWRHRVAQWIMQVLPAATSSQYEFFGATEQLFKVCASQADYVITEAERKAGKVKVGDQEEEVGTALRESVWHGEFALPVTFSTWAHVTMLHMYLLVVRMRCFDANDHKMWQSAIVDHFFHAAEARMEDMHGLLSRAMRQRYLQDLFVQWRGVMLAYDEGLARGDAPLASALWRNLFRGKEDADLRHLAAIVSWMRCMLENLEHMDDVAFKRFGASAFKWLPENEFAHVDLPGAALRHIPRLRAADLQEAARGDGAEPRQPPARQVEAGAQSQKVRALGT